MMTLKRTEWNNGYGCSCCRRDWENSEWIESSKMLSLKEIIDEAYTSPLEDIVSRQYEADGKILYGYRSRIFKAGSDVFVFNGNTEIQITRIGKELLSKKECIKRLAEIPAESLDKNKWPK